MAQMTQAQIDRTNRRGACGRFVANPCECCRKGAPVTGYYSEAHFVVLCKRCAVKVADLSGEEQTALKAFDEALSAW